MHRPPAHGDRNRSVLTLAKPGVRALVVALDGIGDLVLRQPLLSGLADAGAEVSVLVQAGHEELVRLVEPRARALAAGLSWTHAPSVREFRELLTRASAVAPQLLVSAQFDPVRYADWLVRAWSKVPAAGFEGGTIQDVEGCADLERELALPAPRQLDVSVNCAPDEHEFTKASRLAERLTGRAWTRPRPVVRVGLEALESARTLLAELGWASGSYVACCPAGVKNVTIKAWPVERFAEVLARLSRDRGLPALVMGHRAEGDRLSAVATLVGAAGGEARTWLGSRGDLETLAALLSEARLYIGNDTGAMHIAAALGRPVVAVCGGGHWPRFLPLAVTGAAHTMTLPCFGCGWKDCFFGDGPCVTGVPSEAVFQSAAAILNDPPAFSVKSAPLPPADQLWQKAVSTFRMATASRSASRFETDSTTRRRCQ